MSMRLPSVDLPLPLLEARRAGRLVVFAGAGVSRPEPSNLPDFEQLVAEIAGETFARKQEEPPDRFLGRLAQTGVRVHERAARILGRPESLPNELHRLLVEIFPLAQDLRIVTTNFDRHFEAEIAARWPAPPPPAIEVYTAPALPVGSHFSGLAHVHGQLGREPTALVLTDGTSGAPTSPKAGPGVS
jgi:NAD-dependent SIR2 family protein deacetylase